MPHYILIALALIISSFSNITAASERHCSLLSKISGYSIRTCKCGSSLGKYSLSSTKDISLIAVCGYEKESWGTTGAYYFQGKALINGEIRYEKTETFGDWPTFLVSKSSLQALPSYDHSLRFRDEKFAIQKLQIPNINSKVACWTAKASIYLKKLYVLEGPGTDAEGSYVMDFEISKIQPFKRCKPSDSGL